MRILLTLLLLLVLPAGAVFAQDADLDQRKAAAHDLVQLTTADSVLAPMIDAIWPTLESQITSGASVQPDAEVLQMLKQAFTAELTRTMGDVVDDYATAYADAFTLDELNQIVAFYKSDAGAKLVATQPQIMSQMLPKLTAKLQTSLPEAMQKVLEEAQKQGLKVGG